MKNAPAQSDTKETRSAPSEAAEDPRVKLLDLRGKLGDSFGPLNALLSSLAFIALLYSINMQRATSAQQESLQQRQRFEELFSLTIQANREAQRDIEFQTYVKDHSVEPTPQEKLLRMTFTRWKADKRLTSKAALSRIWGDLIEDIFIEEIGKLLDNSLATEIVKQHKALSLDESQLDVGRVGMEIPLIELAFDQADWDARAYVFGYLVKTYRYMYGIHEYQLDAYFRTLYRVFELLSRGESDYGLRAHQVREYAAIARAQLSWHELAFVLLNCVAGEFEKAGRLYNRYALFDNLTTRSSIVTALARKFVVTPQDQAGKLTGMGAMSKLEPTAFDTDLARAKYDSAKLQ